VTGAELLDQVVNCDACADEAPSLCHVHEQVAGELEARAAAENGESGRSISADDRLQTAKLAALRAAKPFESPLPNKTGRSE
jgi:hypothetical protein